MLCSNRPDGSSIPWYHFDGKRYLTTCFDDTVLVPIGPWLFILFTIIAFALSWGRRRRATPSNGESTISYLKFEHFTAA